MANRLVAISSVLSLTGPGRVAPLGSVTSVALADGAGAAETYVSSTRRDPRRSFEVSQSWSPSREKQTFRTRRETTSCFARGRSQFFGTFVRVDQPVLSTRSQNILLDGTYFATLAFEVVGTST
jgi:hypothetical protein